MKQAFLAERSTALMKDFYTLEYCVIYMNIVVELWKCVISVLVYLSVFQPLTYLLYLHILLSFVEQINCVTYRVLYLSITGCYISSMVVCLSIFQPLKNCYIFAVIICQLLKKLVYLRIFFSQNVLYSKCNILVY